MLSPSPNVNIFVYTFKYLTALAQCSESSHNHVNEAIVFSTAEVFIQELDLLLKRKMDSYTGLREIV
jgi:predicted DNA-binding protein with PD1-like motif